MDVQTGIRRAAVIMAFLALAACAGKPPPEPAAAPPPPPPPAAELEAGTWSLASFADASPPAPLSIGFSAGELEGKAFCNRFFGTYAKEGPSLLIGAVGSTRLACPLLDAEQEFFGQFTETSSYEIGADGRLTLIDRSGGRSLVFARP